MMQTKLMKGNEAMAEAAIQAGCDAYFGYPITPQSEVLEYLAKEMPKHGRVVLQAESEVASINMIYGAAGAGFRTMTSSSSPGISLMQEGISYIAGAELPCLIANVNRAGPGLGTIQPGQGDYFQATKGGGHGDYRLIVLAPSSVQEMADFVFLGFDLADKYRNPVMILSDGAIGQMMEKVTFGKFKPLKIDKPWATVGKPASRERNYITSLHIKSEDMERHVEHIYRKYDEIKKNEVRFEEIMTEDAEYLIVAYGLSARISHKSVNILREKGIKAGLLRPITLYPFPEEKINQLAEKMKLVLTVEMNTGQMVEDVRLSVNGKVPVHFFGRFGGMIPDPEEIVNKFENLINKNHAL
ncbi:MAG TPA: 3-methyl-2-oxobutanoate dehydrogenase subunit VorB [Ignavibacteria bacterium]|nr:3-methyl-2-oxobutanoate dehydrogenase subunit VorB [Ignavibacteria bacterium]HRF65028.1 3-methyl-2-oxobutanoate dehydrogenase subunit VorB [Ignavibacteria bacterium]HRJ05107.1 3-methyl-2-oxobutanoate dehydrogenase subunit VorB [Ignavibacteria bacterium]HRJ84919.1 3-methyl-2-oxobutanoate dehydrogenase subunit VorB [Ignavibacteria bacterium]